MTISEINNICETLREAARQEATKLWRLRRKAIEHGVSAALCDLLNTEAWDCFNNLYAYPERILDDNFMERYQFAFQMGGVRR